MLDCFRQGEVGGDGLYWAWLRVGEARATMVLPALGLIVLECFNAGLSVNCGGGLGHLW